MGREEIQRGDRGGPDLPQSGAQEVCGRQVRGYAQSTMYFRSSIPTSYRMWLSLMWPFFHARYAFRGESIFWSTHTPEFRLRNCAMIRQGFVGRCFDSCTHLCYYESRMSALFFSGSLWAVHPGTIAIVGNPSDQCAICGPCKGLICKILG